MAKPAPETRVAIRDLDTVPDFEAMQRLEKSVWGFEEIDLTPLTLAVATKAVGSIWVGAFDGGELVGFAFALPSLHEGGMGFHSHTLAVRPSHRGQSLGFRLKLAQRQRSLALGIKTMTWTFDPLRARNAHLNFAKLGVVSDSYRVDFYGSRTSSVMHSNGTDRLWVEWHMDEQRVHRRVNGEDHGPEVVDALKHLEPQVRFNGNGWPAEAELASALARQRLAIEIPGDIERIEREDTGLARQWREATRRAFTAALQAGFRVEEFCRSIRGKQGPGAYLLVRR